jgi:hypothetical protein
VFGLLPVALAPLAGGLRRRPLTAVAVGVVTAPVAAFFGVVMVVVGGMLGVVVMTATGDAPGQTADLAFGGLTGGAICGALALLVRGDPRADQPAEPDPDRPPSEPDPLQPSPIPFLPMS